MQAIAEQLQSCLVQRQSAAAQPLLQQVKMALLRGIPASSNSHNTIGSNPELLAALTALECGVLLAVHDQDLDAFTRTMALIQPYHHHPSLRSQSTGTFTTPHRSLVLGLCLMHLLVENRFAEFHSELELLTEGEACHPFVAFPISLERQLMVGIYDEILDAQPPSPEYQFFLDRTAQTVRDAIADCLEVSYQSLSLTEAAEIMKFYSGNSSTSGSMAMTPEMRVMEYIQHHRPDWIVSDSIITFQPTVTAGVQDIPSMEWIQQSLTYATEMERII